ncbi:MAG: (2Fe-2S) ferredoxin domain-containing protein [Bdellovibrionales bacterium]
MSTDLELHLFVCTNTKEGYANPCFLNEGQNIRNQLKERLFEKFGKKVRVNNSGCLGRCSKGGVAVIYPQGIWFERIDMNSLDSIESKVEELMNA